MHYFQGDVLTTEDQMAKLNYMLDSATNSQPASQLHSRALVRNVRRTWKDGIVPYVIKKGVGKYTGHVFRTNQTLNVIYSKQQVIRIRRQYVLFAPKP